MATHSSILAWEIPGTEQPAGLQCVGSHRARHELVSEHSHFQELCWPQNTHQWLLVCGLLFNIFLSHQALCSTGAHAQRSALLSPVPGFNKWSNENRTEKPPSQQSIRFRKNTLAKRWRFITPHLFFDCSLEMSPFPFKPYSQLPLKASLPSALKSSQWPHGFRLGRGPLWHHQGPSLAGPQSPGARADQSTRGRFLSAHRVVCQMVPVLLHSCVTCVHALMFTSLREKAEELQGKKLCGGHFPVWQNLPEHAQDWLEITFSGFSSLCQCT